MTLTGSACHQARAGLRSVVARGGAGVRQAVGWLDNRRHSLGAGLGRSHRWGSMVRRFVVEVADNATGSLARGHVVFTSDGRSRRVPLTAEDAAHLGVLLEAYRQPARWAGRGFAVEFIDDLDGSPATEQVSFGLDDATYEIDLSDANAAELRAMLDPYLRGAHQLTLEHGSHLAASEHLDPEGASSVVLSLDGGTYVLDLSVQQSGELRAALAPYVRAGRRMTR